ncbi:MAG: UvrD-helicase domain-containing protein [Patescibacteria group bacterium]
MKDNRKQLNKEQLEAVEHTLGTLLIVAGAGTGKTTVITEKIAYLVNEKKIKADEILALTFTDKAAGEMEERVDKILPYGYTDLWIMTFHSFCERILKAHGLDIGIANDFKLLNSTEQWMLVRENLDKFNLDYYKPLGNPTKFVHALVNHFSRCKDEEISPEEYLEYADKLKMDLDTMESTGGEDATSEVKRLQEISNAYHVYQQLLLDNSSLDFGDLINYTLKLFRKRPNILKKYQYQFKYVLVDEFQDTNWAQYGLVKLLVGDGNNLTVVGDDDQSVYAFRNASMSNILYFKKDFPNTKEKFLNQNYRSSQNILDLAYNFIQLNNPERLEVKLNEKKKNNQLSKKLKSNLDQQGIIEHLHYSTAQQEVEGVINKVIELSKEKDFSFNDVAVLVRANNQAEAFLNGLRNAGIPFNFVASKGLYSKEVIMDVLAYIKLLDNYHESLAMWRVLNFPMMNIKVEDLMEISRFSQRKTLSLYEACQKISMLSNLEEETVRKVNKIMGLIATHTKLTKEKNTKAVVLQFLQDFNYSKWLLNKDDNKSFIYINLFIKKIDEFEKSFDDKSVKNFMRLTELELESGEQGSLSKELEEGPESVKVMTIHAAKGLEFKYVFVVNLVDKRFPSMDRKDPIILPDELIKEIIPSGDVHLQEERRLFYVAMTRAKSGLYLTSAQDYGGTRKKKLSRFIYEIGLDSEPEIEKKDSKEQKQEFNIQTVDVKNSKVQVPTSFSYSQLKGYETCPYQYYLGFILKIPVTGKAVFSYGKTMHSALQKFMALIKQSGDIRQDDLFNKKDNDKKVLPSEKELIDIYRESWIDDWYESKEQKQEYKKQGEKSLKNLYRQVKENTPKVIELEKGFNFKIKDYSIRGVIDRVDHVGDNKVEIIDYKTGRAKTEKTVEKDQLLMYQMAAKETFNWNIDKLTFYYLDNNMQVSFLGTDEEIDKQKEKMLERIKQIRSADFNATPNKFKCQYCDFKNMCSFKMSS